MEQNNNKLKHLPSTKLSSPSPNDIFTLFMLDKERYEEKGYGLIGAFIINILFFSLTPQLGQLIWPKVLKLIQEYNLTKYQGYAILTLFTSWTVLLVSNLVMWIIYHLEHPFFERYKITNEPWPWYIDEKEWRKLMWKAIALVVFNNAVLTPISIFIGGLLLNNNTDLSFEIEDLPSSITMILSIIFCMIFEDFAFHHTHMLLHRPYFYKKFHKLHHEHIQTVTIASQAAHPIEYILGNIIPLLIGPIILGKNMHAWTYLAWLLIRLLDANDGHSGYEFTWSPFRVLPFSNSSEQHAYHHAVNIGNYSSFFSIWDTFYGTNKEFYKYLELKAQLRKKKLEGGKVMKEN